MASRRGPEKQLTAIEKLTRVLSKAKLDRSRSAHNLIDLSQLEEDIKSEKSEEASPKERSVSIKPVDKIKKQQTDQAQQPLPTIESHDDFEIQILPSEESLGKIKLKPQKPTPTPPQVIETKPESIVANENGVIVISEEQKDYINSVRSDAFYKLAKQKSDEEISAQKEAQSQ